MKIILIALWYIVDVAFCRGNDPSYADLLERIELLEERTAGCQCGFKQNKIRGSLHVLLS